MRTGAGMQHTARQPFKPSLRASQRNGATQRQRSVAAKADNIMIVNTSSGGHAFIGLYLAQQLSKKGHKVLIFNDGDESIEKKPPFSQYGNLRDVDVMYGDPKDPSTFPDENFDVVYDNNGKKLEECQPLIDTFASSARQYCFVGSAGAYEHDPVEPMHLERDPRKGSAGHKQVEDYLEKVGAPYTVFHPLYMYGAHTAKDCEQWYIDRIIRDRPVPIPAPGVQLTSISHVEDVAAMMAAAAGNKEAVKQHFNASTDRIITLDGIAHIVAGALGKKADIVHYNEKEFEIPKGKGFPFRSVHFFAGTNKAKALLGWEPKHDFKDDIREQIKLYEDADRDRKDIDFSTDDMILEGVRR